jgi:excisionase family DNA binding protein
VAPRHTPGSTKAIKASSCAEPRCLAPFGRIALCVPFIRVGMPSAGRRSGRAERPAVAQSAASPPTRPPRARGPRRERSRRLLALAGLSSRANASPAPSSWYRLPPTARCITMPTSTLSSGFRSSTSPPSVAPLAVSPREACRLLSLGMSRLYGLMRAGKLQSYEDGRARRIPMASIHAYIARRLADADSVGGWRRTTPFPPPRRRGRASKARSV